MPDQTPTPLDECPARLSFATAPHLDLRCIEPPGHTALHRTNARVRAGVDGYPHKAPVAAAMVYMTWAQELGSQ